MKVWLAWLAVCGMWSTSYLVIKVGLQHVPPFSFAGLRFLVAVMLLLLLVRVQRRSLPHDRHAWWLMARTGVLLFSFNYGLLFWGQQHISAGLAAVLQATMPAWGLVLAPRYLPTERITWRKLAAVALGIIGVTIIFAEHVSLGGSAAVAGSAAVVVGAGAVAYTNVPVKADGSDVNPLTLTTGQMLCGTLPLLVIGLLREGNPLALPWTPGAIAALLYLAVVGAVTAFVLYYWVLQHMALTTVTLHAVVTPLLTLGLSRIFLGEALHARTVLGAACVVASVAIMVRGGGSRHAEAPQMQRDPTMHRRSG